MPGVKLIKCPFCKENLLCLLTLFCIILQDPLVLLPQGARAAAPFSRLTLLLFFDGGGTSSKRRRSFKQQPYTRRMEEMEYNFCFFPSSKSTTL